MVQSKSETSRFCTLVLSRDSSSSHRGHTDGCIPSELGSSWGNKPTLHDSARLRTGAWNLTQLLTCSSSRRDKDLRHETKVPLFHVFKNKPPPCWTHRLELRCRFSSCSLRGGSPSLLTGRDSVGVCEETNPSDPVSCLRVPTVQDQPLGLCPGVFCPSEMSRVDARAPSSAPAPDETWGAEQNVEARNVQQTELFTHKWTAEQMSRNSVHHGFWLFVAKNFKEILNTSSYFLHLAYT